MGCDPLPWEWKHSRLPLSRRYKETSFLCGAWERSNNVSMELIIDVWAPLPFDGGLRQIATTKKIGLILQKSFLIFHKRRRRFFLWSASGNDISDISVNFFFSLSFVRFFVLLRMLLDTRIIIPVQWLTRRLFNKILNSERGATTCQSSTFPECGAPFRKYKKPLNASCSDRSENQKSKRNETSEKPKKVEVSATSRNGESESCSYCLFVAFFSFSGFFLLFLNAILPAFNQWFQSMRLPLSASMRSCPFLLPRPRPRRPLMRKMKEETAF